MSPRIRSAQLGVVHEQAAAALAEHRHREQQRLQRLDQAKARYDQECLERQRQVDEHNAEVDEFAAAFAAGSPPAVVEYFDMVLANSVYPDGFPQRHRVAYVPESAQLVVAYDLPTVDVRHQMVAGGASPDDPVLVDYWATRRKKVKPPLDDYNLRLLTWQAGRCPLCGEHLITADQPPQSPREWERWWLSIVHRAIVADYLTHGRTGTSNEQRTRLVHASCHRALQARNRRRPATPSRP